jgi:hypothetical protein
MTRDPWAKAKGLYRWADTDPVGSRATPGCRPAIRTLSADGVSRPGRRRTGSGRSIGPTRSWIEDHRWSSPAPSAVPRKRSRFSPELGDPLGQPVERAVIACSGASAARSSSCCFPAPTAPRPPRSPTGSGSWSPPPRCRPGRPGRSPSDRVHRRRRAGSARGRPHRPPGRGRPRAVPGQGRRSQPGQLRFQSVAASTQTRPRPSVVGSCRTWLSGDRWCVTR